MIANPSPTTPAPFVGMWVTKLTVILPTAERPRGLIDGDLLPYNGAQLLSTGGAKVNIPDLASQRATDPALSGVLLALTDECKRQANKAASLTAIVVAAPDPALLVTATLVFADRTTHIIPDCFALCAADPVFAGTFLAAMGEVARQAGLSMV